MNRLLLLMVAISMSLGLFAQSEEQAPKYSITGYVKDLQTFSILNLSGQRLFFSQNQIHNRINTRWFPSESFTVRMDLRNRIFWGDAIDQVFIESLDGANDYFDFAWGASEAGRVGLHTMIDRLYVEYQKGNWEVRLGRQRINWGINTVWNPNDVFNAFAFTDFDYEERPGSDALRVKYYTGFTSSVEVAISVFDSLQAARIGALTKLNAWNYDWQILTALVNNELALGGGWAGGIGGLGFKGEFTYFQPFEASIDPSFAGTISLDYMTDKSLFLMAGFLYNSNGETTGNIASLFNFELSAKNLYPFSYSVFLQGSYPFTPILNGGLALIYSPGEAHALFVNPSITYSIKENWDLDLIGQVGFNRESEQYTSPVQGWFLRVKFSY